MFVVWTDSGFAANNTLSLAEADYHVGSGIFEWAPMGVTEERMRAERFFEKKCSIDEAPGTSSGLIVIEVVAGGNKAVLSTIQFGTKKRIPPTITFYSGDTSYGNIGEYNSSGTLAANHAGAAASITDSSFFFYAGTPALTAGNTVRFTYTAECEL